MRYQTDPMTQIEEKWLESIDFGHILTSNYANYAKLRFFWVLGSFANAHKHFILA